MSKKLLDEIETFLSETSTGAFRFGIKASKNGRLVERLRAGGRVWPETENEIRTFMRIERAKSRQSKKKDRAA
ncbi:hypothetical protein [Pseudochrobactrum sp. XF203]|uniref:hypothetical protein n=1 Tax=Pseudochrobactrum sp. XF203 TaxID=2879116 RepID=UPI001CE34C6F|nr:hypothetical protein [Pseudochrobactrum sp. XF203]UCA47046.1 hypothetical protein LDL70_07550 [Pseudochrobactrum sp. XF203]